jgi:hypothetical protein
MQVLRTLIWVAILLGVLVFSYANWDERATVHIWQNLVWDTRLPAVVIVSFLLGMLPVWLLHRGTKWRLSRRISALENAARSAALSRHNPGGGTDASQSSAKDDTLTPADRKSS